MTLQLSDFANGLRAETAFDVLAVAKTLKSQGKDVVELQIGDSPFPTTAAAKQAGIQAIQNDQTHYCPSMGLPTLRATIAEYMNKQHGLALNADHIVVGIGAKVFQQYFCEAVLNPGDEVLVFSPQFPTYVPNIERRQCRCVFSSLRQEHAFRPSVDDVAQFIERPRARAIFLNSPHNPTGGVATEQDIVAIANLLRPKSIALFCDEPYDHMVWQGVHHTPIAQPDLLEKCVAAYTFSKSYSMSGWRLGFAVSNPQMIKALGKMINTSLSCVPPLVQLAGIEALKCDAIERDQNMNDFRNKVHLLADKLADVPGIAVVPPAGTFYVFPNVAEICNRLGITSHGLAMYLLEGADNTFGIACLGGECFGDAGKGFIRLSCAEPDERLHQAVAFLPDAFNRSDRVRRYLASHGEYRLVNRYPDPN